MDRPRLGGIDPDHKDGGFAVELSGDGHSRKGVCIARCISSVVGADPHGCVGGITTVVGGILAAEIDSKVALTETIGRSRGILLTIVLRNSRFGYVSISRASHEATVFTDDFTKLAPQLSVDVSKTSALKIAQNVPAAPGIVLGMNIG